MNGLLKRLLIRFLRPVIEDIVVEMDGNDFFDHDHKQEDIVEED